jgi:hypothetical protein
MKHEWTKGPTCDAEKIVWGIDRDPSARGADADSLHLIVGF